MGVKKVALVIALLMMSFALCFAQTETALLSGRITDQAGAIIPGAEVTLTNVETNVSMQSVTNGLGLYVMGTLQPGHYRLTVSKEGFKVITLSNLVLSVQDTVNRNFELQVGSTSESITVLADAADLRTSPAVGTVVDQKLVGELPLNGQSFQNLFQLTPGVVVAPTNTTSGQFSVNGQRTNANYFIVDGAGANAGATGAGGTGAAQFSGGSLPSFSALGGTNTLVSTEAVQEFAIQTSSFAPEFGRTPGGQISIVTRSGTNQWHGGAFDYLRNDLFDANDWFADQNRLPKAELRQNDFGGTFGGPIFKNKTFFFLSYEGLRLRQPTTALSDVPTLASRNAAPTSLQGFFNAYPLPSGPDEGNGLAPANYTISNPSALDAGSVRIDHHIGNSLSIFGRYNNAPSTSGARGVNNRTLNTTVLTTNTSQTVTLGLTYLIRPNLTQDARFNWTTNSAASSFELDKFGGAVPDAVAGVFPSSFTAADAEAIISLAVTGRDSLLSVGRVFQTVQRQLNFIDNVSWQIGSHSLKVGVDYRRLTPQTRPDAYAQAALFLDIPSALTGSPILGIVQANATVDATFANYSAYGQDTWRATPKLTFTYGLRWDYNPAPQAHGSNGLTPFAVTGIADLSTLSVAPSGTPLFQAPKANFAPRFGFAYDLRNAAKTETVVRAGAGVFYDLGNGPVGAAFSSSPFTAEKFLSGTPFPFSSADAAPPSVTANPPFSTITAFPSEFKLPYIYQWNLSIQQSLGSSQTITATYVGSAGHSLLRQDNYLSGSGLPTDFSEVDLVTNEGYSKYNAFQMQFQRRMTSGLDVLASYTLGHSLDNVSSDVIGVPPGKFVNPATDYASSDFDVRHTGSIAVHYELPNPRSHGLFANMARRWSVDPVLYARSSPTVDVTLFRDIGFGQYQFRPDVLPGVPLYLEDGVLPGGRGINPAALVVPPDARQGDLGRNFFRGFPLFQLDFSAARNFRITERMSIQARVDAFNIFNHPNFAPEQNLLGRADSSGHLSLQNGFGISSNMLNQGLNTTGFGTGFNPLFQIGGPRSLQLALKMNF
jgi:outer membrane receptor protein involved in Fe transport